MANTHVDITNAIPRTISHLIGNRRVVEQVRVAIDASFTDNKPFPHTLFVSTGPGQGKTTLAKIVMLECGVTEPVEVLGSPSVPSPS